VTQYPGITVQDIQDLAKSLKYKMEQQAHVSTEISARSRSVRGLRHSNAGELGAIGIAVKDWSNTYIGEISRVKLGRFIDACSVTYSD
jgi:hypothetical protein